MEYLGHCIDREELHTTSEIEAIQLAPRPKNQHQLRSFLGLVQYYGKFIPNLASLLSPLNVFLKKDTERKWMAESEQAFVQTKEMLSSATIFAHYDPILPLHLAADASVYGAGAVISHVYPDGSEQPIGYASRALTASEKNYTQIEKEALSLIFGVCKFHQYL